MRKKIGYLFVLSLAVLLFGCSKKPAQTADILDNVPSETTTGTTIEATTATTTETTKETTKETTTEATTETATETVTEKDANLPDTSDLNFSDLVDLHFSFSSGAGAWSTELDIMADGTFRGYYHDSEAGSTGPGYPNGTIYECYFSGTFASLKKVGDYEYSIKCESLTTEGTLGEEKMQDNIRTITSEPYGFVNADEFLLYLPGKHLSELPEYFLLWAHLDPESNDVLPFYGLYNDGGIFIAQ